MTQIEVCPVNNTESIDLLMPFVEEYAEEFVEMNKCNAIDIEVTRQMIVEQIRSENGFVVVAEDEDDNIKGLGIMMAVPMFLAPDRLRAFEGMWHSDPKARHIERYKIMMELFHAMEDWATEKNVHSICFSVNPKNTIEKYLIKQGYDVTEKTMVRVV